MPVLVEAISVIVRRSRIDTAYPGGWPAFVRDCPNATLCADEHLARVGFMVPADVEMFVRHLESTGLRFLVEGRTKDIVVVDQLRGPTAPCDWLECGHVDMAEGPVTAARLRDDSSKVVMVPDSWSYDQSLSAKPGFVASEGVAQRLKFLGRGDGTEIYEDRRTGKRVYVGRTQPTRH